MPSAVVTSPKRRRGLSDVRLRLPWPRTHGVSFSTHMNSPAGDFPDPPVGRL